METQNKRYPRTVMATACIPWDENYEFDEIIFRKQIKHMVRNGISSIYLFGTAGEGYAVSENQFKNIVNVFAEEMNSPELLPMIGVISLSLPQIIDRIKWCCRLGLRDFQISFPSWGALNDNEVIRFFDAVLKTFPKCRFMHYNNGLRSKKILSFSDYERLWPQYPNLAAVKFPGVNENTDFTGLTRENPIRFFPLETGYEVMSGFNECGLLISKLNISYKTAWEYLNAGVNNDRKTVERIVSDVKKAREIFSDLLPAGMMDGAYDKLYTRLTIPEFPNRLYPPYDAVDERLFQVYKQRMQKAFPSWFE